MDTLDLGAMLTSLGGGLALFLYGMRKLTESLKTLAGSGMKDALARMTTSRFSGLAAGAAVTAVVQSSSVTTVLVVGFVSAGLMTLPQSVGVIMGANVGTTVTAQIVAFKITAYALVMIAGGFLLEIASRSTRTRQAGIALMGLGLLFFGMELMSEAMAPLRGWPPFGELMRAVTNPVYGIAVGLAFTALVQSSSATTGVVIVLAAQGLVDLETGIALAFGANIGTCVTALLSTIGRPREAVRAAVVHVIFNVVGVAMWVMFIPELADGVRLLSAGGGDAADAIGDAPRQIANAHTVFNVVNAIVLIGFAGPIARLATRVVPHRARRVAPSEARYLEAMYLDQPAVALDRARLELERLGERAIAMAREALAVVTDGNAVQVARLRARDDSVDELHGAIVDYLARAAQRELVDPLPTRLQSALAVANYLENVADVVETDLMAAAEARRASAVRLDPGVLEALDAAQGVACEILVEALAAYCGHEPARALEARERKPEFTSAIELARTRSARSIGPDGSESLARYRVETDVAESYVRIHSLARRIARVAVLESGE